MHLGHSATAWSKQCLRAEPILPGSDREAFGSRYHQLLAVKHDRVVGANRLTAMATLRLSHLLLRRHLMDTYTAET